MLRYERQMRLADVGRAGQERLGAARIVVDADGFAAEVAVRYLAGAGVGQLRVRTVPLAEQARSLDPALDVRVDEAPAPRQREAVSAAPGWHDPVAGELARGSLLALSLLRGILQGRP